MHISIEMTASGKTFGIAFAKKEGDKPFAVIKGNRIVSGSKGEFVSGPSAKMDDGKYLNYTFYDQAFNEHVLKLYREAAPQKANIVQEIETDLPF